MDADNPGEKELEPSNCDTKVGEVIRLFVGVGVPRRDSLSKTTSGSSVLEKVSKRNYRSDGLFWFQSVECAR